MITQEQNLIRTTHPRFEINEIESSLKGWELSYFDKEDGEDKTFTIHFHTFVNWLADLMFDGKKWKATRYVETEPEWSQDYMKEFFIQKTTENSKP